MAFVEHYRLNFQASVKPETSYRIIIYEEGYGGGSVPIRCTGAPIRITWPTSKLLFSPTIRGSRAVLNVFSETDFQFLDFFNAAFAKFKIELIKDPDGTPVIEWVGFNEPGQYGERFVDTPYDVQLAFTDGLAELKNLFFTDDKTVTGNLFTGKKHLLEMWRLCLNQVNPLNIVHVMGVYDNTLSDSVASSMATQTYVRSDTYTITENKIALPQNSFDVLQGHIESLPSGCIYQRQGKWWVVRQRELIGNDLDFMEFVPSVGSESATANIAGGAFDHVIDIVGADTFKDDPSQDIVMLDQSGQIQMTDKIRKFNFVYRPNVNGYLNASFLKNSYFDNEYGFNDDDLPTEWERSAGLTNSECVGIKTLQEGRSKNGSPWVDRVNGRAVKAQHKEQVYGSEQAEIGRVIMSWDTTATTFDNTKYVRQSVINMPVTTSDRIKSSIDVLSVLVSGSAVLNIKAEVRITPNGTSNHQYLTNSGSWMPTQFDIGINIPGTGTIYHFDIQRSILNNATIPFTGPADIRITVYKPFRSGTTGTFSRLFMYSIAAIYGAGTEGSQPTDEVDYTKLIDNNNQAFSMNAMHGSGPDEISERTYRGTGGNAFLLWNRRGIVETRKTWEIWGFDVFDLYSGNAELLSGTFRGIAELNNRINVVVDSITYSYGVNGRSWDVKAHEQTLNLTKILAFSYVATDHTKQLPTGPIEEGPPPSGGGSGDDSGGFGDSEELQSGGGFNPAGP